MAHRHGESLVKVRAFAKGSIEQDGLDLWCLQVGLGFSGLSQLYGETIKSLSSAQRVFELIDRCDCYCDQLEAVFIWRTQTRLHDAAPWLAGAVLSAEAHIFRVPSVDQRAGKVLESVDGAIQLLDVRFTYPSRPEVRTTHVREL